MFLITGQKVTLNMSLVVDDVDLTKTDYDMERVTHAALRAAREEMIRQSLAALGKNPLDLDF